MMELLSLLLIPDVMAGNGGAPDIGGGGFRGLIPLLIIFAVFYFLIIRPQQKKMKQHQNMVNSLKRGDKVVTGGGIIGTVTKVDDEAGVLDVDLGNGMIVKVVRSTVSDIQIRSMKDEKPKEPEDKTKKKK